jgi:hypothetical protein
VKIAIGHLTGNQVSHVRWVEGSAKNAPAHFDRIGVSIGSGSWNQSQGPRRGR